jgi:hypothetical protein
MGGSHNTNRKETGIDVTLQKIAIRQSLLNEQFYLQRQRHMEVIHQHSNHINKASSYQTDHYYVNGNLKQPIHCQLSNPS